MDKKLPGLLVTGASGFIGRHFIIAVTKKFRLFCLARRSQKEAGIPVNENIKWLQADISKWEHLLRVVKYVKENGGADYVLHLAGYYDFKQDDNIAYERTNVTGTRYVLNMSQLIGIKHFIFTSSLAACKFPPYDKVLTEESPPDADFPYARSKRRGEAVIKGYSNLFSCSTLRLAAVYSDWCEYPPLYILLKSWLTTGDLKSRVLGGKGESAVPYIHVKDLVKMFLRVFERTDSLPRLNTFIASPNGSVSHKDLFKTATKYYYGKEMTPIPLPKFIAGPGLLLRSFVYGLLGKEPFEQPWMVKYIDLKLSVDASATYQALEWEPTSRYHILRRLLFLTEKMTNHHINWTFRNEALLKRVAYRKSGTIFDILGEIREKTVEDITAEILKQENASRFTHYREMDVGLLTWYVTMLYQLIATTVRNRDRSLIHNYVQIISSRRFVEGFGVEELKNFLKTVGKTISSALLSRPEMKDMEKTVYDYIYLTMQLTIDEVEDTYEILESHPPEKVPEVASVDDLGNSDDIKRIVRAMEDLCSDSL